MKRINLKKSNGFINDYKEMKLLSISEVFNITQRKKYLTIPNVSTPNIDLKEKGFNILNIGMSFCGKEVKVKV